MKKIFKHENKAKKSEKQKLYPKIIQNDLFVRNFNIKFILLKVFLQGKRINY